MSEKIDPIKVVVRMRPLIAREKLKEAKVRWKVENSNCVSSVSCESDKFYFDRVFNYQEENERVYKEICLPIVESIMQGFNGTVFAYGQTSSGKSYTMLGRDNDFERGVIQYAIDDIFNTIERTPDREFLLRVSFLEIYNEKVFDLLSDKKDEDLSLLEDIDGQVKVKDLKEEIVQTKDQILDWMLKCQNKRRTAETCMNKDSSRSHFIFRMIIESRLKDEEDSIVNVSQLNLVDLAGSENAAQTRRPQQFKEGVNINVSLFNLSQVIKQLSDKRNTEKEGRFKAPFRNSKLTRILQNSLGGNALTAMVCTITPVSEKETLSTLKFAQGAKEVKNKAKKNEIGNDQALLKEFANKIKLLTKELEASKEKGKALEEKTKQNEILQKKIEDLKAKFVTQAVIRKNLTVGPETKVRHSWGGHLDAKKFQDQFPPKNTFSNCLPILEEEPEVDTEADFFPDSIRQSRASRSSGFSFYNNSSSSKKVVTVETQTDSESSDHNIEDALMLVTELKNELLTLRSEYEELNEYTTLEKQHLKAECELQAELEALKNENFTLKQKIESLSLSDKVNSPPPNKFLLDTNNLNGITESGRAKIYKKSNFEVQNPSLLHQFLENSLDSDKCMSQKKTKGINKFDLSSSTLLDESLKSNFMAFYDECMENDAVTNLKEEIESLKYEIELKDKQINLFNDKMQIKEQMISSLQDEIALSQNKNLQTTNETSRYPQVHVICQTDVMRSPMKNIFSSECQTSPGFATKLWEKCNCIDLDNADDSVSKLCSSTHEKSICSSDKFSEEKNKVPLNISPLEEIETGYGSNERKVVDVYTEMSPLKSVIVERDLEDQTTQVTPVKLKEFSMQCCRNQCNNQYVQTSPIKDLDLFSELNQCSRTTLSCQEPCMKNLSDDSINQISIESFSSSGSKVDCKLLQNDSAEKKDLFDMLKQLKSYTIELMNGCLKAESIEDIDVFESETGDFTSESFDKEIKTLKNCIDKFEISIKDRDDVCEILSNRLDSKVKEVISLSSKLSDTEEALNKKESDFSILTRRISEVYRKFAKQTFICSSLNNIKSEEQLNSYKKSSDMIDTTQHSFPEVELNLLDDLALKLNSHIEQNGLKVISLTEKLKKAEDDLSVQQKENANSIPSKNIQCYETEVMELKSVIENQQEYLNELERDKKCLVQRITDLEDIKKDLQHKLATLEASHSREMEDLDLKFEESKFDWTQKTENLIKDLEEKYEQELMEQQNKLSEEHSEELYKQKEVHLKELSEMKLLHSSEMSNAEKCYKNKIKDLEEQLFSENSEKEALERQLENKEREFRNKLQDCRDKNAKKIMTCKDMYSQLKTKLSYYLEENEKLRKEIKETDLLEARCQEDIREKDMIICELRMKLEQLKNTEDLSQNTCSNCKGTEEINKKLFYDLDQKKAKITSLEANNTSLVQELKKFRESLSHKTSAHCKCKTNGGYTESSREEKNEGHKNKGKSNVEQKYEVEVISDTPTNKKESADKESPKENIDPVIKAPTQENTCNIAVGSGVVIDTKVFLLERILRKKDKEINKLIKELENKDPELIKYPVIKAPTQENIYNTAGGSGVVNDAKCFLLEGILRKKDKEINKLRKELANKDPEIKCKKRPVIAEEKTEKEVEVVRSSVPAPVAEINEDVTVHTNAVHPYPQGVVPKVQRKPILKEKNIKSEQPQATKFATKEVAHDWKYPSSNSKENRYGSKDAADYNKFAAPECKQQ